MRPDGQASYVAGEGWVMMSEPRENKIPGDVPGFGVWCADGVCMGGRARALPGRSMK